MPRPDLALLDLLLPNSCASCGVPMQGPCCERCQAALQPTVLERVVSLGDGSVLTVAAATPYAGPCRHLLLAYKEHGRHELAPLLAGLQARAVLGAVLRQGSADRQQIRLVPVPSRSRNRRARGADVGLVLARATAALLRSGGWPARVEPSLRHRRRTADQAGLSRQERSGNLAGSLVAVRGRSRTSVVVVDDILTTGATLREATRALRAAADERVNVAAAVVAATPRSR